MAVLALAEWRRRGKAQKSATSEAYARLRWLVPRLFLIDSFGFIFRAYHARARSARRRCARRPGISTEAVYIFHNMVRKLHASVPSRITSRRSSKAGPHLSRRGVRKPTRRIARRCRRICCEQIPWIRQTAGGDAHSGSRIAGFEADDVIGTLARRASRAESTWSSCPATRTCCSSWTIACPCSTP